MKKHETRKNPERGERTSELSIERTQRRKKPEKTGPGSSYAKKLQREYLPSCITQDIVLTPVNELTLTRSLA